MRLRSTHYLCSYWFRTSRRHIRKGQTGGWIPNVVDDDGAYGAALRKATQWIGPDRSGFDIKPFEKEAEDQRPWYTLSRDLPIHTEGMKELEETSQRHTVTKQDIEKVQADIKEILKAVRNNQELSGAGRGSQEQSGAVVISQGQSRAQVSSIHMSP